jgi:branched-chain amino acid aminotransferase
MSRVDLQIEPTLRSRLPTVGPLGEVAFSTVMSDHMLIADYADGAWRSAEISPYGPLALSPAITALHYGVSVIEGLKAHRTARGEIALFRPRDSVRRLNRSAARLAMPSVPEDLLLEGLRALVRLDGAWAPPLDQGALYIRPVLFSTDESLRVKEAERYKLVVLTAPYGAYYPKPLDLLVNERYARAFLGGTGDVKPAGNYAPTLVAEREARRSGFDTTLWLDARERACVEECNALNVFFVIGDVAVTPSLEGTILPGITRDSVITLLEDMGVRVEERRIGIDEVVAAHERGDLRECFGVSTAATLSQVRRIGYRGRELMLPPVEQGRIALQIRERFMAIATGRAPDRRGWLDIVAFETPAASPARPAKAEPVKDAS